MCDGICIGFVAAVHHHMKMLFQTIVVVLLCQQGVLTFTSSREVSRFGGQSQLLLAASTPSWSDLESQLGSALDAPLPVSIDSVLQPKKPSFSTERPTLFRERHGWCPCKQHEIARAFTDLLPHKSQTHGIHSFIQTANAFGLPWSSRI